MDHIRNFCIIAHIDHGKSTLADRFIQRRGVVSDGSSTTRSSTTWTSSASAASRSRARPCLPYTAEGREDYVLNLVDTPGHVDFSYEVSRSAACEGAVLLIDASQGVEAQTLANMYMALEHDLEIIPVINKIDLPAPTSRVRRQIDHDLGLDPDARAPRVGQARHGRRRAVRGHRRACPRPRATPTRRCTALIFDSHYDPYRGVVVHVRIFDGTLRAGQRIRFMSLGPGAQGRGSGIFQRLKLVPAPGLPRARSATSSRASRRSDTRVGDTVTDAERPAAEPLAGFREVKPVVFSSIYPVDANDYEELVEAIAKLKLNDASLIYEKDSSVALGYGFRCGFLGLLHLEIVQERLEREFDLSIVFTAPSVPYRIAAGPASPSLVDNPANFPRPGPDRGGRGALHQGRR